VRPLLFAWGPLRVHGYGFMIALGGILSFWFLRRRARDVGLKSDEDFWLLVNAVLIGGFAGGRLLYLAEYTRPFSPEFWRTLVSPSRGFSVFGAFVGVPLGAWIFCRWTKTPFARILDAICVMAPFWHVFGRLGCLLAGCCHGRPTKLPWGLVFRDPGSMVPRMWLGVPLHPTQLIEAALDAFIAAVLYRLFERGGKPGLVCALYFALYGALRFGVEFLRGDTAPLAFGLTAAQALGLGLIASSGVVLAWRSGCCRSS